MYSAAAPPLVPFGLQGDAMPSRSSAEQSHSLSPSGCLACHGLHCGFWNASHGTAADSGEPDPRPDLCHRPSDSVVEQPYGCAPDRRLHARIGLLDSTKCVTSVVLPVELRGALRRRVSEGTLDAEPVPDILKRVATALPVSSARVLVARRCGRAVPSTDKQTRHRDRMRREDRRRRHQPFFGPSSDDRAAMSGTPVPPAGASSPVSV